MGNRTSDLRIPRSDARILLIPAVCRTRVINELCDGPCSLESISLPSLKKHTILLILFTEHDAIGIADPSSMQYACHIKTFLGLFLTRISVAQW